MHTLTCHLPSDDTLTLTTRRRHMLDCTNHSHAPQASLRSPRLRRPHRPPLSVQRHRIVRHSSRCVLEMVTFVLRHRRSPSRKDSPRSSSPQVRLGLTSSLCNLDACTHNGSLVQWRRLVWSSSGFRSAGDGWLSAVCRTRTNGQPNWYTYFLTHKGGTNRC